MPPIPPPEVILAIAIVIFFAIGIHEYCHCKFAELAGDPTPRLYGRVTLNLTKHFEPLGTFMIVLSSLTGVGLGWGKPAPMNEKRMRNPRWDLFAAVLAGPVSNVVQALVYALVLRVVLHRGAVGLEDVLGAFYRDRSTFLAALLTLGVQINLGLAVFNMIPIGPLDGHWLFGLLLPEKQNILWNQWHRRYGRTILWILVLLPTFTMGKINPIGMVARTFIPRLFTLFTGVSLEY